MVGLHSKYNIYASTLDQADVNVMHECISQGTSLLLKNHVFQFDFLNDDFSKLPQSLQDIINDEEKRKKLVIYINPPYAEATSSKTVTGTGENKSGVTTNFKFSEQIQPKIGNATNEIFALFMAKIYEEIPNCKLGQFSKMKFINGSNFKKFKEYFLAEYKSGFIVPADTFDNVKGNFPIGFTIWDTAIKTKIEKIKIDIYEKNGYYKGEKIFYGNLDKSINKWIQKFYDSSQNVIIGYLPSPAPDFQNQNFLFINIQQGKRHVYYLPITKKNIFESSVYFSVRHAINSDWLNDRDQFLSPNDKWVDDIEFKNDCLVFILFHGQNRVSIEEKEINHWIPFTEQEVDAQARFESNFMTDFIKGKHRSNDETDLFGNSNTNNEPLVFSDEAKAVFDAGRELWKYYQAQNNVNVNASLYDIREYFQGRNDKGRMNSKSSDETYTTLIGELRNKLSILAEKITPKIYEYEFLKE